MGTHDFKQHSDDDEDRSLTSKEVDSDNTMTTAVTAQLNDSYSQSRGEEDDDAGGYSSDLGYSDDSASLSDAYFSPQIEDLGRQPPSLLAGGGTSSDSLPLLNDQPYHYGSINNYHHHPERPNSPFWLKNNPIHEDVEMKQVEHDNLLGANTSDNPNGNVHTRRKERRKRKRSLQRTRVRGGLSASDDTQQQTAVQATVNQNRWKDKLFAVLFLIQLALVSLCALRYGLSVVLFHDTNASWTAFGKFYWQRDGYQKQRRPRAQPPRSGHRLLTEVVQVVKANMTPAGDDISSDGRRKPLYLDSRFSDARTDDLVDLNEQPSTASYSKNNTVSKHSRNGDFIIDYHNVIALVGIAGFYACILTYLSFGFMLILARSLIQIMLGFSILLSLAWGLIGLYLDPYGIISFMGFVSLVLTLGHIMYSWNRIPFAATNLYTALCAMRCTADIAILGVTSLVVALIWCIVWSMAFIGIVNSMNNLACDNADNCEPHVANKHVPVLLLLLLSFHWSTTVIKNVVRVTVASAIGTWWFYPREINPVCSPAVIRPLSRSLSSSLGSICLGSLVVQFAQIFTFFGRCCSSCNPEQEKTLGPCISARSQIDREQFREIVADEPNGFPDSAMESLGLESRISSSTKKARLFLRASNRWSFTYIGMYSYGFVEAGERAIQLFETRDWMVVVRDNLINNVLLMSSVVIGGSTGIFAAVIEESDGYEFSSFHQPVVTAFVIGAVVGYILSDILLRGVVGSAVNTVLVCFAAAPREFDRNHPLLSRDMRETWNQQVWKPASATAQNAA